MLSFSRTLRLCCRGWWGRQGKAGDEGEEETDKQAKECSLVWKRRSKGWKKGRDRSWHRWNSKIWIRRQAIYLGLDSVGFVVMIACCKILHAGHLVTVDGVYTRHLLWRGESPPKELTVPQNGCQIVCFKSFFRSCNELQTYHGNFLLMDNKHRKLFVITQSKGLQICAWDAPKYVWRPGSARTLCGSLCFCAPPDLLVALRGSTSKGRERMGMGIFKGREGAYL